MKVTPHNVPKNSDEAPGLEFPCTIDVKIFVNNGAEEEALVLSLIHI